MQIDWTTFVLEIVNFLVLVWILKHFLYRPVLDILARRRAGIEQTLMEARATEARAAALKAQFEGRLADWEAEKAADRVRFDAELAAERARQLQALREALRDERDRGAAQAAHRDEALQGEMGARALAQAVRFTTTLLTRLAGPELQARLTAVFLEDFAKLTDDQRTGLRNAAALPDARARVASAYPLTAAERERIAEAIATELERRLPLDELQDPALLAGLRVQIGAWQLQASLADELAFFAATANHAE
jgi:F-type H+-transporting ATPase subunit b